MNKEFVPEEIAVALKELGFDEPCFKVIEGGPIDIFPYKKLDVPTYSQAFRWFREKHHLLHSMDWFKDGITFTIYDLKKPMSNKTMLHIVNADTPPNKTYEEAEQACLIKLIEIVKEKQL